MRNGWRDVKLKDVCEEITVGHVGPMADQYVLEGVPFLRSQNIGPFRIDTHEVKFITTEFHRKLKKSALSPGDVVVVRTGYPGTASVIPEQMLVGNCADLVIIRPSSEIDSWFLTCLFNSAWGRGTVAGKLVGVAQQHFNVGAAKEMVVHLPPLATQRKIATILSAYDELIENNTRRIKILEGMAQSLYREWFVDLRFPGHDKIKFADSPLGKIPANWEIKSVGELVQRVPAGKKYETKTVSSTGAIPVLDQGQSGIIGYHNDEPGVVASKDRPIIVFANHTCYQRIIQFPFSAIQNVLPFLPNPERHRDIYWLHWATKDLVKFNDYKGHWPEFMSKKLLLPSAELCNEFGQIVKPMLQQTFVHERRNAKLKQTQNLLLPKLISGEIAV